MRIENSDLSAPGFNGYVVGNGKIHFLGDNPLLDPFQFYCAKSIQFFLL